MKKPGETWLSRQPCCRLGLLLWLIAGCATGRSHLDQELKTGRSPAHINPVLAAAYTVSCPDVLELDVAQQAELSGLRTVGPDGRIDLGSVGRLRVEGRTIPEVTKRLAELADAPPELVQVRVAEYRSQQIFLFGQVFGSQRAVAYEGQESVLDLLQRVGVTPGAAAEDVYVVRSRITDDRPPQVFHIDLQAIMTRHDQRTNLRLQPFDQVYIGQSRRSHLETIVPPCFRSIYERLCGLYRTAAPRVLHPIASKETKHRPSVPPDPVQAPPERLPG